MNTRVYGRSDDLIEIDGPLNRELTADSAPVYLMFSDGTYVRVEYAPEGAKDYEDGMWRLAVINRGTLYLTHTPGEGYETANYSDVVELADGITSVTSASGPGSHSTYYAHKDQV